MIHDKTKLINYLKDSFVLDWHGIHGAAHWARVRLNGLRLAELEAYQNPRLDVIELFAFLHDHKRLNDGHDPDHGPRAAKASRFLNGDLFYLDDEGFALLDQAMTGHSDGYTQADITVQICWDADRLDLGRVGILPDPKYLCTESAKRDEILQAAFARSKQAILLGSLDAD